MTLITTIAGSTSDSYSSLVEANTYFTNHFDTDKNTSWSGLTTGAKEQALRTATMIIDSLRFWDVDDPTPVHVSFFDVAEMEYIVATSYNTTQSLKFPRNKDIDINDVAYIPQEVKWAQCEQAIYMVRTLDEDLMAMQMQGVTSDSVGIAGGPSMRQTYSSAPPSSLSPIAWSLLRKYNIHKVKVGRA